MLGRSAWLSLSRIRREKDSERAASARQQPASNQGTSRQEILLAGNDCGERE